MKLLLPLPTVLRAITILHVASSTIELVGGFCLLQSQDPPENFWYRCINTTDYLADLKRAPVDVRSLSFSSSIIPTIRDRSFARFGKTLKSLSFDDAGVREIEDDAFQGLVNLEILRIEGNSLKTIKGAWFRGLPSLKSLGLANNHVERIETNFFTILPPLKHLSVTGNNLTCLPVELLANFRIEEFLYQHNPFTWTCLASISKWLKDTRDRSSANDIDTFDLMADLATTCVLKFGALDDDVIGKCAENTSLGYLLDKDGYTTAELCQRPIEKISPFVNCTR